MKTILVIDDSTVIRMQVAKCLQAAGFHVRDAVDGRDALDKLDDAVDAIVCDVNMPRMDGLEFLHAMTTRAQPAPPTLMLTTEADPSIMRQARELGVAGWLIKPFRPDLLLAAIQKLVE